MAKWTLTIKNNETGEETTEQTNGIFAVVDVEQGTRNCFMTNCNGFDLISLFTGVMKLLEEVKKKHQEHWAIAEGFVAFKKSKEGENDE